MKIGYARVSVHEQDTQSRTGALNAADCERIHRKKPSGAKMDRPELRHPIDAAAERETRRIGFQSLTESVDTADSTRKPIFQSKERGT